MLFYNAGRKARQKRFSGFVFLEKNRIWTVSVAGFFPIDDCGVGSEIVKSKKNFVKGIRFSGFFPFEKPAAMEYNKDIE